jgi:hypothetical protein
VPAGKVLATAAAPVGGASSDRPVRVADVSAPAHSGHAHVVTA